MFFNNIFEDEADGYPTNGTLEEKAMYGLEQIRRNFWYQRKFWLERREGGAFYNAMLLAHGDKVAQQVAKGVDAQFRQYLKDAFLTEDGQTTDAKYPTDKMINHELRRIRSFLILNVSQAFSRWVEQLPESARDINIGHLYILANGYVNLYEREVHDQVNTVIPGKKVPARTAGELHSFFTDTIVSYSSEASRVGFTTEYLLTEMKRKVLSFLLQELPFDHVELSKKDELVEKPADPEQKAILH